MRTLAKAARTAWVPAHFVPLLENRSALLAVRLLAVRLLAGRPTREPLNPLVLHGPPGTGKTHLANALHEHVAGSADVTRLSAADWSADDVRACNLLIVEDLQHLPDRCVNDLIAVLDFRLVRGRATLITASKGPAELPEIPARLANRLAGGLVVGLELPTPEGRRVLLGKLAKLRKIDVSNAVIEWLAEHTPGSARQLTAALARLEALAATLPRSPEVSDVAAWFRDGLTPKPDVDGITRHVSRAFGVTVKEIRGRDRQPRVLWPRQIGMYLARKRTNLSLAQIGEYFGRDHSTVRHACQKVDEALGNDPELPGLLRQLQAELG